MPDGFVKDFLPVADAEKADALELPPMPKAKDGKITKEELRIALAHVARMLRAGDLVHVRVSDFGDSDLQGLRLFNMSSWCEREAACGTVACIGGWIDLLVGMQDVDGFFCPSGRYHADGKVDALWNLFYPENTRWESITPAQAANAIDNYLRTGDPDWASAIKAEG